MNWDTGAVPTALPVEMAQDIKLQQEGEFVVASGAAVPNYGQVRVPCEDEQGHRKGLKGAVTRVHKPLGSGAELSNNYDSFCGAEGGVLVPKGHPLATEMRRYYQELKHYYGNDGFVRLYRERNLFNFYVKKVGPTTKVLGAVDEPAPAAAAAAAGTSEQQQSFPHRQAQEP